MLDLCELHSSGVFLRRDAIRFGYTDRDLSRAVRAGLLVRVRHGAYVDSSRWRDSNEVGRHVIACHAVILTHESPVALSHVSGAALHGLRLWDVDLSRVHVSRLGVTAARKQHDVAYHDCDVAIPMCTVEDAPALSLAHSALGAAAMSSVESGLVVIDSAYDSGRCDVEQMRAAYQDIRRWPGTARLQITMRLARPGAESVGESRARYLFFVNHLPSPVLQYRIYDAGQLVGISDFAWPEHGLIGEFDGKVKYGALLRPGEDPTSAVFREKVREDRIREATGWNMVRLTWSDLNTPRPTAARIRRLLRISA